MQEHFNLIRANRKTMICFAVILFVLISTTPALADYLGPNRTRTETNNVCKVFLYECQYVAAKEDYKYKTINSWPCSNESKPWQNYSGSSSACNAGNLNNKYWERDDIPETVTTTYPPATITGSLENCVLQNGWCITAPQLVLSGSEPVAGESIIAIEGFLNDQTQNFACMNSVCRVPLSQGYNGFFYWALSSFGDSSTMGTLAASVDSEPPNITGAFNGLAGANGWYVSPVTFNGSASDATAGLDSFTCALDGVALGSCTTIVINTEGFHSLTLNARDGVGHLRTVSQNASIDTQTPTLNAFVSGKLGSNNWYTAATFNASAADPSPGSGLAAFEYNLDNTGWTSFPSSGTFKLSEGKHTIDVRAVDQAGHTVSSSKSFWVDSSAPNLTVNSGGTVGNNEWYLTNPTITASVSDDTSGMDVFEYHVDDSSWTTYVTPVTLGNGTHQISFWAQDEAGLVTQVERTYRVDTRPPQIAGSLNGVMGLNGWYISEPTISASASDPTSGSGLDAFTYIMNGKAETPYSDPLTLSDGQHTVQLNARDKAGQSYSIEQTIHVDTTHPSLKIESVLPNWVKDKVTLSGAAGDGGSGLSKVEISMGVGQIWQDVTGTDSWNYVWNTANSPNGSNQVHLRVTDLAGLTTQQTLNIGVDNHDPEISLPDSWLQWDTVTLDIWDNESGLSQAQVEITDPQNPGPKRVIQLDPQQFPLRFKWDRRFSDNTIADAGTYSVKVIASDSLGNTAEKTASIRVLIDLLPPGPTATLFAGPTSTSPAGPTATLFAGSTSTPLANPTATVSAGPTATLPADPTATLSAGPTSILHTSPTATLQPYIRSAITPPPTDAIAPHVAPRATPTAIVIAFGAIEPTAQVTPTPASSPTPRFVPTQADILDWLQSVLIPQPNEESVIEIKSPDEANQSSQPVGTNSGVLWGTAATAAIGSAMAYVEEEKRKREEEKARKAALDAAEEERREKKQERKLEKMEEKRAQEQAWQIAREEARREKIEDAYLIQNDIKIARLEAEEEQRRILSQLEEKKRAEEKKKEAEEKKAEKLKDDLYAAYNAVQERNKVTPIPEDKKSRWEKGWDWVDEHQREIALGIGVVAGAAAIIASGGLATPLVAAALTAGAAGVAIGAAAVETVVLNAHYGRDWNENLLKNVAVAGGAATFVTGGWFVYQALGTSAGAYCVLHKGACAPVDPILKAWDAGEEIWLNTKLTVQTWRKDEKGAAATALDLYSEYIDGGVPGNTTSKELRKELSELTDDAIYAVEKYGDDAIPLIAKYGNGAVDVIGAYGDEGISLLQLHGQDAVDLIKRYGDPAVKVMQAVDPKAAKQLLETLDDDVLDYAIQQGPDAVEALSGWSAKELEEHGVELALRAKKDAKVIADVRKLIKSGSIDPKRLTEEQRALVNAIAANSTQYADGGQVVLGKWVDISNGFVETAQDTGSVHYNPHPDMWNLLGDLGKENRGEVAWLINQQVVQTGINKGLPFEYTLNGVPAKVIENEHNGIEAVFAGKTDAEILEALDVKVMPIRMRELKELKNAGYKFVFDELNNSYILTVP